MVRKGKKELREQQSAIWGKLHTEEVVFYDASTHPLGDSKLTIRVEPIEKERGWTRSARALLALTNTLCDLQVLHG